jgi:hypothetical protein
MGDRKWEESQRKGSSRSSYDFVREGWSLGHDGGSRLGVSTRKEKHRYVPEFVGEKGRDFPRDFPG